MLIRRHALQRIGGIAAVRGALIDKMALAQAMKAGGRIWLGHSGLVRSKRTYPGFSYMRRVIARTAFKKLQNSWILFLITLIRMGLAFVARVVFVIFGAVRLRVYDLLAWAGMALWCWPGLRRFGLSSVWGGGLLLVAGFFAVTIGSALGGKSDEEAAGL